MLPGNKVFSRGTQCNFETIWRPFPLELAKIDELNQLPCKVPFAHWVTFSLNYFLLLFFNLPNLHNWLLSLTSASWHWLQCTMRAPSAAGWIGRSAVMAGQGLRTSSRVLGTRRPQDCLGSLTAVTSHPSLPQNTLPVSLSMMEWPRQTAKHLPASSSYPSRLTPTLVLSLLISLCLVGKLINGSIYLSFCLTGSPSGFLRLTLQILGLISVFPSIMSILP